MGSYVNPQSVTSEDLVRLARDGNLDAQGLLVHRFSDRVARFLQERGASDLEAEKLTCEVLDCMLRDIGRYAGRSRFSTWVLAIARHRLHQFRKSSRNTPEFVPLEECYEIPGAASLEPDELARRNEEIRLCRTYLEQLTEEQREALTLTELQAMSLKEAAAVMGCTPGSVAMLVDRAKRRLRKLAAHPGQRAHLLRESKNEQETPSH
jgi:RNA polymerase sigma factor (sigma-70 family)